MRIAHTQRIMGALPIEPREGGMLTHNVQLLRRVAEGGMGSIWLAQHLGLDLPVAVKLISPRACCNASAALERFAREARVAAHIRHPNVVQILDYGVSPLEGGRPYILMEYLEGEELEQAIGARGRLPLDETVSIVQTIADVLEQAHERGIVHRDIKPGNVFLHGPDKVVKVLDFGVARDARNETELSKRTTEAGEFIGTPFFMSPEQFVNPKEADHRCDLWALGVLAYEALVGRMPFEGTTPTGVFLAAMSGNHVPPTELVPELPPAIDAWFREVFAPDPARRFSSAKAMADALVRAAHASPSLSASPSSPEPARERLSLMRILDETNVRAISAVECMRSGHAGMAALVTASALVFVTAFLGWSTVRAASAPDMTASRASVTGAIAESAGPPARLAMHISPLHARAAWLDGSERSAMSELGPAPTERASTTRSEPRVRHAKRRAPRESNSFFFLR